MRSCLRLSQRLAGLRASGPCLGGSRIVGVLCAEPVRSVELCNPGLHKELANQTWSLRTFASSDESRGDSSQGLGSAASESPSTSETPDSKDGQRQDMAASEGVSPEAGAAEPEGNAMKTKWREWMEMKLSLMEEEVEGKEEGHKAAGTSVADGTSSSASGSPSAEFQLPPGIPPAVEEPLAHPFFGFSELGSVGKDPPSPGIAGGQQGAEGIDAMIVDTPPRVSPTRIFYPGQTYMAGDLNPFTGDSDPRAIEGFVFRPRRVDSEVRAQIDFKNRRFLSNFLSEQGQLMPRRRSRLRAKTHRKVMRAVKLARCMALLPPTSKLPQYSKQKNPYSSRTR